MAECDFVACLFLGEPDLIGANSVDLLGERGQVRDLVGERVGPAAEGVDVAGQFAELMGDFGAHLHDACVERSESGGEFVEL